jgi:acetaldehyde dehydrogenase
VPGYILRQEVQFEMMPAPGPNAPMRTKITSLIEVTGAGHYLPPYAGNLDIMTSAAAAAAEQLAGLSLDGVEGVPA